jgi:hypothetical protein
MKERIFFLLIILSLIAVPLLAVDFGNSTGQAAHYCTYLNTIKLKISGSAIPLANPLAEAFPILANYEGLGNLGRISGQGMYLYSPLSFGSDGKAVLHVLEGQTSCRMEINGEVLLGVFDPGDTGWIQFTDMSTGSAVWEQTWTGKIVGGTGQFAGKKGTIKKHAKGLAVLFTPSGPANAVIQPWSGTLEIHLED